MKEFDDSDYVLMQTAVHTSVCNCLFESNSKLCSVTLLENM